MRARLSDRRSALPRSHRRSAHRQVVALLLAVLLPAAGIVATVSPAAALDNIPPADDAVEPREDPVDNPPIVESCGIDTTLVLDASGSIIGIGNDLGDQSGNVRDAADVFIKSLTNTDSTVRLTQFATVSEQLAPRTLVDDAAVAPGGTLSDAVEAYYRPRPQIPSGVDVWRYDGSGDPALDNNWDKRTGTNNVDYWTNWDQSLGQAEDDPGELVVYLTDGDPTSYDFAGDPKPAGDVSINAGSGQALDVAMDKAVTEANAVKSGGARIIVLAVGQALQNPNSVARLTQISGPQVVTDDNLGDIDSLNEVDVALIKDFDKLGALLRALILELCSPSMTIRKLAESPAEVTVGGFDYLPTPRWDITVTPEVDTDTDPPFQWILPDPTDPPGSTPDVAKTVATNKNGNAQFQWEPNPSESISRALVQEEIQPGYEPGRPDGPDWNCTLTDEAGRVRTLEGELEVVDGVAQFEVDPIGQEIVTCDIYNSLLRGDVEIEKVVVDNVGDIAPDEYTVEVVCAFRGNPLESPYQVTIGPGSPGTIEDLPVGTTCTVTEIDDGGPPR